MLSSRTKWVRRVSLPALAGKDGPAKCAASVVPAYSDQHLGQLTGGTPFESVTTRADIGDQRARGLLAGAGIDFRMQDGPLEALSGGQRARLAMLRAQREVTTRQ